MYEHLLVPLDTSDVAELALPPATELAARLGSKLHLVSVVAIWTEDGKADEGDTLRWESALARAREYLEALQRRLDLEGLEVEADVRQGDVAEEILRYAAECDCDVIVMCTHGRTGPRRWVYGSVADRLLRQSSVPILLIRAEPTSS